MQYYYVYVLQSEIDGKFYTGFTKNIELRFEQHQKGQVESTRNRRPLKLIYYEACISQHDATHREKYSPCGIKSMILMRSIIPQGKKLIMEKCLLKTGSNLIYPMKSRSEYFIGI